MKSSWNHDSRTKEEEFLRYSIVFCDLRIDNNTMVYGLSEGKRMKGIAIVVAVISVLEWDQGSMKKGDFQVNPHFEGGDRVFTGDTVFS